MTIVKRSLHAVDLSEVDWAKIDATTEADIVRQIAEDPDTAPDMGGRLRGARVIRPRATINVKAILMRLGLSQNEFARAIQDREQRRRQPEGAARLLLAIIDREPELTERVLAEAGQSAGG